MLSINDTLMFTKFTWYNNYVDDTYRIHLRIHNIYKRSIIIRLSTINNSISEHNTHSINN